MFEEGSGKRCCHILSGDKRMGRPRDGPERGRNFEIHAEWKSDDSFDSQPREMIRNYVRQEGRCTCMCIMTDEELHQTVRDLTGTRIKTKSLRPERNSVKKRLPIKRRRDIRQNTSKTRKGTDRKVSNTKEVFQTHQTQTSTDVRQNLILNFWN